MFAGHKISFIQDANNVTFDRNKYSFNLLLFLNFEALDLTSSQQLYRIVKCLEFDMLSSSSSFQLGICH